MNSQRGSLPVVTVVIIIVVAIIGGAGYLVWHKDSKKATNTVQQTAPAGDKETTPGSTTQPNLEPSSIISGYTLPAGWTQKSCGTTVDILLLPGETMPPCGKQAFISVFAVISENPSGAKITDCEDQKAKLITSEQKFKTYACKTVIFSGKTGIRKVIGYDVPNFYSKPYTEVTYNFPTKDGGVYQLTYQKYDGTSDVTEQFDSVAKALKFKY